MSILQCCNAFIAHKCSKCVHIEGSRTDNSLATLYEVTTEQGFKDIDMGCCTERHFDSVALELNLNVFKRENTTLSSLKYIKHHDRWIHKDVILIPAQRECKSQLLT